MPAVSNHSARAKSGRNILRWFFEFAVLAFLLWLVYILARRALPKIAIGQISELTNTKIEFEAVRFDPNGSVFIEDLVVKPHRSRSYDNSILKAESVHARFSLLSLFLLSPRLKEITVDDFVLNIQHDLDTDRWNLSVLTMPRGPKGKDKIPLIWLEKGEVQYSKVRDGRVRIAASTPVSASFRPAEEILGGYSFSVTTTPEQSFEKSRIVGLWVPGRIEVGGRISSKDIPGFDRPWIIDTIDARLRYNVEERAYWLSVKIKDLFGPPSAKERLFAFESETAYEKFPVLLGLQTFFARYRPAGRVDIDFLASGRYDEIAESSISGTVHCTDGSASDKNFPYKVEQVRGEIDFSENSVTFDSVRGRHGDVEIQVSGWCADFGPDWKYQVQITSDNMALDKDLYDALGPQAREFWSAFSPSGVVAMNYSLSRWSGTDRRAALAVELLDVDGKYEGFAYPLNDTRGFLFFSEEGTAFSNVVSQVNDRRISINGTARPTESGQSIYDILIKAENVPLDKTLEASLPASQKSFYELFELSGLFDANIAVFTPDEHQGGTTYRADVSFKDASLGAKESPLAVSNVSAEVIFTPDSIEITDFKGRYGEGLVSLTGQFRPGSGTDGLGYCVSVHGEQMPLDKDLLSILPKPLAGLVADLGPEGKISFTADLDNGVVGDCSGNSLTIECLGNSLDSNMLPYPLQDVTGKIYLTESRIEFDELAARAVHNIRGRAIQSDIKVTGQLELEGGGADVSSISVRGGQIELAAENFRLAGKTLRTAEAVFDYKPASEEWISRNLLANFYGGKMIGTLELSTRSGTGGEFLLKAGFTNADLREFLSDKESDPMPMDAYTTGRMSGSVNVVGRMSDSFLDIGHCRLDITHMQVGRLSPFAKLLAVLNLTEPTDHAFDKMLVDSYIKNNRVYFRKLDLSGESLAFSGSGWMDLSERDVNLTLTARGHRLATASPSILRSLTEGLGQAVVRIDITGTVDDPQIKTTTLPVIRETLGIFGTKPTKSGK